MGVGHRDQVTVARGSEGLHVPRLDDLISNSDLQGGLVREFQIILHNGEPGVTETIDIDYLRRDTPACFPPEPGKVKGNHRGWGHPFSQIVEVLPSGQVGRHRGEHVTAVKGAGDGMHVVSGVRQLHRSQNAAQNVGRGQEDPIVRTDQEGAAANLGGERPPLGLVPRVYDRQVDAVFGHIPGGVPQRLRALDDVKLGDGVGHVYYGSSRRDALHHATTGPLQDVGEAVVRYKAYGPHTNSISHGLGHGHPTFGFARLPGTALTAPERITRPYPASGWTNTSWYLPALGPASRPRTLRARSQRVLGPPPILSSCALRR